MTFQNIYYAGNPTDQHWKKAMSALLSLTRKANSFFSFLKGDLGFSKGDDDADADGNVRRKHQLGSNLKTGLKIPGRSAVARCHSLCQY
jgi:hypothetical protein